MEKIFKFVSNTPSQNDPIETTDLTDQIRAHGLEDLNGLSDDLAHLNLVVKNVQKNYQEILRENQRLKSLLRDFVEDCYCWEGNRCPRCQTILDIVLSKSTEKSSPAVNHKTKIREKLRKLG